MKMVPFRLTTRELLGRTYVFTAPADPVRWLSLAVPFSAPINPRSMPSWRGVLILSRCGQPDSIGFKKPDVAATGGGTRVSSKVPSPEDFWDAMTALRMNVRLALDHGELSALGVSDVQIDVTRWVATKQSIPCISILANGFQKIVSINY